MWVFALFAAFGLMFVSTSEASAQDEGNTTSATFTVMAIAQSNIEGNGPNQRSVSTSAGVCKVEAELKWYQDKRIQLRYHLQGNGQPVRIDWAIRSVQNAKGSLSEHCNNRDIRVFDGKWNDLKSGDNITLHTSINGQSMHDVIATYYQESPVWPILHTDTPDESGMCFWFSGRIDPWGTISNGRNVFRFHLNQEHWTTPLLAAPNTEKVTWEFWAYEDEAETQLRAYYKFPDVPNPCYQPPQTKCESNQADMDHTTKTVTGHGQGDANAVKWEVLDPNSNMMANGVGSAADYSFQGEHNVEYKLVFYNSIGEVSSQSCVFSFQPLPKPSIAQCKLSADHHGDPLGDAYITTWVVGKENTTFPIEEISINWDFVSTENYPNVNFSGPFVTGQQYHFTSDPIDIGFGMYTFTAVVVVKADNEYVTATCQGNGHAVDHDNVVMDAGPFGTAHEKVGEIIPDVGYSNLPNVPQLPHGNPKQTSWNLYKFEVEMGGTGNKSFQKLLNWQENGESTTQGISVEAVGDHRKIDGVEAGKGFAAQIGQDGPIYAIGCTRTDGEPTDITFALRAGGMTNIEEQEVRENCWGLTWYMASIGAITIDQSVAVCLANLGPIVTPNGELLNRFSFMQDQTWGTGPKVTSLLQAGFVAPTNTSGEAMPYNNWPSWGQNACNPDGSLK